MSVAMDIMRALDPAGLERFKIELDTPAQPEKIGEVWTLKVVPFEHTDTSRKAFNQLFDNHKTAKSWVVENKAEAIAVVQELYLQYADKLPQPFDAQKLNIDHYPATGRYSILIHIREIWE
ncbi:hypothetical protein ACTJJ0_20785 [Chitinophaga sp. 22321]|uniref:Uncharacterized protein n=1 Tax=Chitinophaga hostae TaxID=2831022 RepID=A0ABS5J638_9BACT|nr:hypothetical protein [Chitinophaga hostae]MBS0029922.1 hypothetical protein [Chitinophaga hostae]